MGKNELVILAALCGLCILPLSAAAGTLGNTSGGGNSANEINTVVGSAFTATTSFTATTIYVFCSEYVTNGGGAVYGAIYNADSLSNPTTLLGSSSTSASTGSSVSQWFSMSVSVPIVAGNNYFLAANCNGGGQYFTSMAIGYGSGGSLLTGGNSGNGTVSGGSWPSPLTPFTTTGESRAIYITGPDATDTPTASPTPSPAASLTQSSGS